MGNGAVVRWVTRRPKHPDKEEEHPYRFRQCRQIKLVEVLVIRIARRYVKRPAVVPRINDIPEMAPHGALLVVGPKVPAPCQRQVHKLELQR